jgi:small nuclear ribonucleoprotein (snRNP)-like protein
MIPLDDPLLSLKKKHVLLKMVEGETIRGRLLSSRGASIIF